MNLRQAEVETQRLAGQIQRAIIDAVRVAQNIWRLRFSSFQKRDPVRDREAIDDLKVFRTQFRDWREYAAGLTDFVTARMTAEESRVQDLSPDSPLAPLIRDRLELYRQRLNYASSGLQEIGKGEGLIERWSAQLQAGERKLNFGQRSQVFLANVRDVLSRLWNFELFNVSDSIVVEGQTISGRRSITLGKILGWILLIVIGYFACRFVARLIGRLAGSRFKMEKGSAEILRKWVFGLTFASVILADLIIVKIPFAAFAFLGGALAIGVGFGTQNLVKNLMSGIMILTERPMRVGDIIEVVGAQGTVRSIGLRLCDPAARRHRGSGSKQHVRGKLSNKPDLLNQTKGILANGRSPLRFRCPDCVKNARTGRKGTRVGAGKTSTESSLD